MEDKGFVFAVIFAALMLTGCPQPIEEPVQLDITEVHPPVSRYDAEIDFWSQLVTMSAEHGTGAYVTDGTDIQQSTIAITARRAGPGTHCIIFTIGTNDYYMLITVSDNTVTFGDWMKL